MLELLTCAQMKACDADTIQKAGIPSMVLMERAALAVVGHILEKIGEKEKILIVCGSGNNGGDGIAIARLLHIKRYCVSIYMVGNLSKLSTETAEQKKIADYYGVHWENNPCFAEYTTIVDAIFGVGLTRDVEGRYASVIEKINTSDAFVWAVDIPSGIHGDNGTVMKTAVRADATVTFAYGKIGLYMYPGASYCGTVYVEDIGIYRTASADTDTVKALEVTDLSALPKRKADGNKGTFGKVLVVAGGLYMAGAAYLSARGVLRSGAGMVKIHTVPQNRTILHQLLPEALLYTDEGAGNPQEEWRKNLQWADVLVIGPGLGTGAEGKKLLEFYLKNSRIPVILDADALNLLAEYPQLWEKKQSNWVLTPHMGEFSRLTEKSISELKMEVIDVCKSYAVQKQIFCVAKDARSTIAAPDGQVFINLSGNEGMATAGSGDVLSGILGGLAAQGIPLAMAVPLGVYLHGMAGDKAREYRGSRGMTAGDLPDCLAEILKMVEE